MLADRWSAGSRNREATTW